MARTIFITAAEASGDQHAAELATALRQADPSLVIEGFGGPKMAAAGVTIRIETVGRAAMGWRGALRALEVSRWMKWIRRHYRAARPDLHICVDSSAMNLPFAKLAKRFDVPVMYYIAPQLWASREYRMKQLRRYVDRVACIFPFEEPYFRAHDVNATFVGHPLFDELPAERGRTRPPETRFPATPPVIGIVPGSRRSEVRANLPHLMDVMDTIRGQFSFARFLIPTTLAVDALVRQMLLHGSGRATVKGKLEGDSGDCPSNVEVVLGGFDALIPRCDLCITKSGTSTLHVAAWNVPMIVVYRVNPLLWHAAARWLIRTRKIAMVNILAGQIDLVPEFIPWYGPSAAVAACAIDLLKHPQKLDMQRARLEDLVRPLARAGASANAAKLAIELMEKPES
jgi:lipid-A-disaccharide synthase